ncbi:murein L,D-transpeptidase family protein [Thermodesulfobacteriota bacterium]
MRKIKKRGEPVSPREVTQTPSRKIEKTIEPVPPREDEKTLSRVTKKKTVIESKLWDGPILYHKADSEPIHILLVEKAIQKLHLYRYDGQYKLLKSYACATGEQQGTKREEKDEKTPEGIYFNVKAFRDNKITLFGDRAFGLNYPDVFDDLAGNTGDGIFIHGSNRDIDPFSTNGCVVLDNLQLADLDKRISFKKTPVIIGERLPYRFSAAQRDLTELIPFFEQAMVPKQYARLKSEFRSLTVLGFRDRVVAMGDVRIKEAKNLQGFSRIYLAGPGQNLLVLIKREWSEERPKIALAKPKPKPEAKESVRIKSLIASWRSAWESKQLDKYIAHYHPSFVSDGKNRNEWKAYKGRLNKRYKRISVGVSNLKVKVEGSRARAYFVQRYRSDQYKSDGYKRLELRKKGNTWKIYREKAFARKPAGWPS